MSEYVFISIHIFAYATHTIVYGVLVYYISSHTFEYFLFFIIIYNFCKTQQVALSF
jgi:hypothetical protein